MFDSLFFDLTKGNGGSHEREEGVAYFKAAKSLLNFASISYVAFDIPRPVAGGNFVHCCYSDEVVRHKASETRLTLDKLDALRLREPGILDWSTVDRLQIELDLCARRHNLDKSQLRAFSFPLPSLRGESSTICFAASCSARAWQLIKQKTSSECRILAQYFHSHVLRLNGTDVAKSLLISARELDCLKWTAAGKTAWEASQILGISERTVRFHLNAAREKMDCATTTQAVAKAVANQMIAFH